MMTAWTIIVGSLITSTLLMLVPVLTVLSFVLEWHSGFQFMFYVFFVLEYLGVFNAIFRKATNDLEK